MKTKWIEHRLSTYTKKDTPRRQVLPVSYSPETGENITVLEAEQSKVVQKTQNP